VSDCPRTALIKRHSEQCAMQNEPPLSIETIARKLAAALMAAAAQSHAHDEPQREISSLEKQLIEAFRNELQEAMTVRV
jgi:hypothetical protein